MNDKQSMNLNMSHMSCGFGSGLPTPKLDLTDQQYLMTIYLFIKNYVSASSGSSNTIDSKIEPIDNKIEQAMDLVKSHLLLAVREEVDVLKASITKLVDKINVLERENEVLRNHAPAEVLAQLEPATVQQPAQQFQSPPQQFQPAAVSPTPATPAAVAPPPQQPPPPPSSGV